MVGSSVGCERLGWPDLSDVLFAKGDLTDVSSYTTTEDGQLFDATSLDISGDDPVPGAGLYYLVRFVGCGSWQTTGGSEPGRDLTLP